MSQQQFGAGTTVFEHDTWQMRADASKDTEEYIDYADQLVLASHGVHGRPIPSYEAPRDDVLVLPDPYDV